MCPALHWCWCVRVARSASPSLDGFSISLLSIIIIYIYIIIFLSIILSIIAMAESVADILGCPLDMATSLLEAAGGDPQLAVELGLGLGSGMMGGGDDVAAPAPLPPSPIWPDAQHIPDSWKNQRLDQFYDTTDGIIQPLNGPCGVLAVVQAELWLLLATAAAAAAAPESSTCTSTGNSTPTSSREERLTRAIQNILRRILQSGNDKVAFPDGTTKTLQEASQQIRTAFDLVQVAATSYGIDKLVGSTSTLVEGPHWLCSSELMCLLLRGTTGNGNFGAFDALKKTKSNFYTHSTPTKIGVLSLMEITDGVPVADDLKFEQQVYVLHTGDHFVTMRPKTNLTELQVYDGLQPNGPIFQTFELQGDTSLADKAPDHHVESFTKKRVGQPDDIVQAKKHDQPSYKDWTFEVVPAIDDPDVQGPWDEDPHESVYDFETLPAPTEESSWRCATCYANRFKTMNFGTNPPGSLECEVCQLPRQKAMWSLWQRFDELSPRMQRRARHMYAPKLELVLSTLYPKADIIICDTKPTTTTTTTTTFDCN